MPKLVFATEIYMEAQDEMLALLPQYRHPIKGHDEEHNIFFRYQKPAQPAIEITYPLWYDDLKKETSLSEEIKTPLMTFIDEALRKEALLTTAQMENTEMMTQMFDAWCQYQPEYEGEDSMTRGRRALKVFGLSKGKRPPAIQHRRAYGEYFRLIRKKGLSRRDATESIQKLFGYKSIDATLKALHTQVSQVKDQWQQDDKTSWETQNIQLYFEGFVLDRRQIS